MTAFAGAGLSVQSLNLILLHPDQENSLSRKYPTREVKLLFGRSAGFCAFPLCSERCLVEGNELDVDAIVGDIAHIYAHSDDGPRGKPDLSPEERDCYDNWVLLCATHHRLVDRQPNSHTAADLAGWKRALESRVTQSLRSAMGAICFAELEVVCRALVSAPSKPSEDFIVVPPHQKILRNRLSDATSLITMGLAQAWQVREYLKKQALLDPDFPERLRTGFVIEYRRLTASHGDAIEIFEGLRHFAAGVGGDFKLQAASLAVLAYLFEACEIFER